LHIGETDHSAPAVGPALPLFALMEHAVIEDGAGVLRRRTLGLIER
jgi:hypothetical protein